ncbi:lytic transglycosylase [Shewanella sp. NFH-SH190041]|uniref:lytic murein transglycosylase n=1 Tax=Shewanella sp. NFH-SH190041 TaxID=2950245 RepID=UPI0021C40194|nr:lytic murein transglycosylase [Shewanella sp. NFH-SH190041]BDM64640.1 lytic transglycosylase [Shewanella sp. NFH-SH190041]
MKLLLEWIVIPLTMGQDDAKYYADVSVACDRLTNGVRQLKKLYSLLTLVVAAGTAQAQVQSPPLDNQSFKQCLVKLQQTARQQGISEQIVTQTLGHLSLVPRVIELDRRQPEFTQTFADYFNKRVTDWRVQQGRKLLQEYRPFLTELTHQYGVPAQYLVAFWGMETNFGRYKGKMPILDSLATLACDHRRSEYFTGELMQALKLKQKYRFSDSKMVGSWAGAMGHTQFMPSAYANYAVDGDGDGQPDLWSSTQDALASAAHFLQQLGWKRDERWGREVTLPADFDYGLLGKDNVRPLSQWAKLGVQQVNGKALPALDMPAVLYLPAGYKGPAFIAYGNFDVMMRWNRSVFYALAVGHLADRIAGAGHLLTPPPQQQSLSREQVKELQNKLNALGLDVGKADGIIGPKFIKGLQVFQQQHNLVADGFPRADVIQLLTSATSE